MIDQKGGSVENTNGDDLLSLASHELRTSLSIVKWYAEMLLDGDCGPLNDDQIKYLKTIQGSNQRSIDLIKSLLNVSRLNLDTFCISPTQVDLTSVMKGVLSNFEEKIESKKLHIIEEYMGNATGVMPTLQIDKQIATILIRSLVSNAISFSKENSEIKISVNGAKQDDVLAGMTIPEDCLIVSVSDNGIGIPKNEQDKIFSKLFKASNAKVIEENGSGLSLFITQSILSKIGGLIWFNSVENVGTTFYLTFPKKGMTKKDGKVSLD